MQVDHGGALAVVSHTDHEFPKVRARVGGELVAGMPQVVKKEWPVPVVVKLASDLYRAGIQVDVR